MMKNLLDFGFFRKKIAVHGDSVRKSVATRYLKGTGLEIGALHEPLPVPSEVCVSYVDRFTEDTLRKHYPELAEQKLVKVDIVDDGQRLEKFPDATQDFIIANHFLEHCANPVLAFRTFFRVLKKGGVLYLSIPDKRYTFDSKRPITTLRHLFEECGHHPERYRHQHFEEWVRYVDHISDPVEARAKTDYLMEMDYSIHFHVWTQKEIFEFLNELRTFLDFEIEYFIKNGIECIFILTKNA